MVLPRAYVLTQVTQLCSQKRLRGQEVDGSLPLLKQSTSPSQTFPAPHFSSAPGAETQRHDPQEHFGLHEHQEAALPCGCFQGKALKTSTTPSSHPISTFQQLRTTKGTRAHRASVVLGPPCRYSPRASGPLGPKWCPEWWCGGLWVLSSPAFWSMAGSPPTLEAAHPPTTETPLVNPRAGKWCQGRPCGNQP